MCADSLIFNREPTMADSDNKHTGPNLVHRSSCFSCPCASLVQLDQHCSLTPLRICSNPNMPRSIRARTGATTDPIPHGKKLDAAPQYACHPADVLRAPSSCSLCTALESRCRPPSRGLNPAGITRPSCLLTTTISMRQLSPRRRSAQPHRCFAGGCVIEVTRRAVCWTS